MAIGIAAGLAILASIAPSTLLAQPCRPPATAPRSWQAPLNRTVELRAGEITLHDALDRVASAARIRLSYSDVALSLDSRVCSDFAGVALGDALLALLGSSGVTPTVAGAELVVLTPPLRERADALAPTLRLAPLPLERVLVTGTATGGAQRSLSVAVGVVTEPTLRAFEQSALSSTLNGAVAGVWLWQQSPNALTSRYGSLRGASSFGVSYPKVYVDGVEAANPLVMTYVSNESLDRVELLRGPQGAALYGTDAISGVLQLVTRAPSLGRVQDPASARIASGVVTSSFSESGTFGQDVTVRGQQGSAGRAVSGSLAYSRLGAFVPDASSQRLSASGRGRMLGNRTLLEATARLGLSDVSASSNPILLTTLGNVFVLPDSSRFPRATERRERRLRDSLAARLQLDRTTRQSLQQFTGGISGTMYASSRFTHKALVGVDMYALDGAPAGFTPLPSSADSALRAAEGSAMRASARFTSAAKWSTEKLSGTVTVGAEHAVLREVTSNEVLTGPRDIGAEGSETAWRQTTGLLTQFDASVAEEWFATGGVRLERSAGFTAQPLHTLLPMFGLSRVSDVGPATVKVRGAYGKGIRPPRITIGGASIASQRLIQNPQLGPESQAGTELGLDLFWGRRASFSITRFDQRASGLVQPVAVLAPAPVPPRPRPGDPLARNIGYQFQNVGAIDNNGWELEGTVRHGPLSIQSSLSLVSSVVSDIRRGYSGELRPGDRMLDVPAQTLGVSAMWTARTWSAAVRVTRVADWIGYDRLGAATAFITPGRTASTFVGESLREFWLNYPAVTRLGIVASRDIPMGLSLQVTGENLLGTQVGEPDNITIVPGRLVSVGIRARFP